MALSLVLLPQKPVSRSIATSFWVQLVMVHIRFFARRQELLMLNENMM